MNIQIIKQYHLNKELTNPKFDFFFFGLQIPGGAGANKYQCINERYKIDNFAKSCEDIYGIHKNTCMKQHSFPVPLPFTKTRQKSTSKTQFFINIKNACLNHEGDKLNLYKKLKLGSFWDPRDGAAYNYNCVHSGSTSMEGKVNP